MSLANEYTQKYEYAFEVVRDRGGATDVDAIAGITRERALKGWRLIIAFTNELGKNAISVGGLGVNSSVDQTILVFERETEQKTEHSFHVEAPVMESNIIFPLVPKSVTFFEENGAVYVSLKVACRYGFALNALQGNLIVRNLFGDEITVEDVCFFSFEKNQDGELTSSPYPITLPDRIRHGIANAGLSITRYIGNNNLETLQDTAVGSIAEAQERARAEAKAKAEAEVQERASRLGGFDVDAFFAETESMHTAADIWTYVQQINEMCPDMFHEEMIQKLDKLKYMERAYGNMKKSAISALHAYFDSMGADRDGLD